MAGNGIQLLPESRREIEIKVPGENRPTFIGVAVLVVVLILFFALQYYINSLRDQTLILQSQFIQLDETRDREAEQHLVLISEQLSVVGDILDRHIIWSHFLDRLQAKTSPQIKFTNLRMSFSESEAAIEGEALNYTVVARQIASYLSEPLFQDVVLNEIRSMPTGRLAIIMKVIFNPEEVTFGAIGE